jgi:homeobox protein cut-like
MIDALTNRSKVAETAFLSLYKLLAEAPDPYPILEATVAELVNSEEAARLVEENARLRSQVEKAGDINQLRIQLRQKETQTEELVKERVAQKEKELNALMDEKERNWAEKEQEYQKQITESREMVKDLKVTHEAASARLSAQDEKFGKGFTNMVLMIDEGVVARLAEMDIVVVDLERSNLRIAEVERRNGELRAEIAALQSGKGTGAEERANKLEANLRNMELEYDSVAQRLERLQTEWKEEQEANVNRVKKLEKEVARRQEEIDGLRTKLRSLDDYDEMKRELEILKVLFPHTHTHNQHIEFSIADEEDSDGEDPAPLKDGKSGSSLETLLVTRNKKLSNDLTILRVNPKILKLTTRWRIRI